MAAPVAGFGLGRGGHSTSAAAEFTQQWLSRAPDDKAQQGGEPRRDSSTATSTCATTGAIPFSASCSSVNEGTADGTASVFGKPFASTIGAATFSPAFSPPPCPGLAPPRGAAPHAAFVPPVAAPPACSPSGAPYGLDAASTRRKSRPSVGFGDPDSCMSALAAAMRGAQPPAVAHKGVGGLTSSALAASSAPPSGASGSPPGSNSSTLLTYAGRNPRGSAESVAQAAAAAGAPLPAAPSLSGASVTPQQRWDYVFTAISAGRGTPADRGQSTFSRARIPPHDSSGVHMTGTGTQQSAKAAPRVASDAHSVGGGSAGAPGCKPPAPTAACSSPLHSSHTFYPGRSNCRRRTVDLSLAYAAGQTVAPLSAAPAATPRPPPPYMVSTRTTSFAQTYATAAARCAPASRPATVFPATATCRVSSPAAEPFGGSVAADVGVPRQSCPSTLPARSSASNTAGPAAPGVIAVAASGAPAAATAAVRGTSGVTSVAGGGILAPPLRRACHGHNAAMLLRENLLSSTDMQQQEVIGRSEATAAQRGGHPAVLHDSVHNVSRCSRDAAAAVSARGAASDPAHSSASAAAGATCPTTVPLRRASAGKFVGTSRGAVSRGELSLRVQHSTVNIAGVAQASAAPAPRTVLPWQPEELRKTTHTAHSEVTAEPSTVRASKTVAVGIIAKTGSTAATSNPTAAGDLRTAASGVAAAGRVAASVGGAASRSNTSAAGSSATAALCNNWAPRAGPAGPAGAAFLQRTKRVPREKPRPPRRVLPYEMILYPDGFCPSIPARSGGVDSLSVSRSSSVFPAAARCAPSVDGASAALAARSGDPTAIAVLAKTAAKMQQADPRAVHVGPRLADAAGSGAAFRTPQQPQRPPWRALTPEQLLLQRASRKRLHAGDGSSLQPPCYAKSPPAGPASLSECCRTNTKKARTTAEAEARSAGVIASRATAAEQHTSAEAERRQAATAVVERVPPAVCGAAPAVGLLPGAGAEVGPSGRPTAQEVAAEGDAAVGFGTAVATASDCNVASAEADSCRRSSRRALASAAEAAEPCKSEARRSRKPSRLSLEAAETYSLTVAFKQQRRTSARTTGDSPAAHVDAAASSSPSSKHIKRGGRGNSCASRSRTAATEEAQTKTVRQPSARRKGTRAESSPKRRSVQLSNQQQQPLQQQSVQQQSVQQQSLQEPFRQQEEEGEWTQLMSSQEQDATTYAAALQRQPVFLESCRFTLHPPGFASSPAAVRRVCLPGTLQQPTYVPSAASLSSVQQTLERQQQEAAALRKCHANISPATTEAQDAGRGNSKKSKVVIGSNRSIDNGSSTIDVRTTGGSEAGVCKDAPFTERSGGSVARFIENTTVSGYLYRWYARMHVSAQLETQLQQLLAARERLAQQLCDGSELHSNLFFFSLFPQDYGLEAFKRNLRFFPQYAVATAAAEAAGLQPLELYRDSSCTAAIAETARKAKLMEELYEEEQLMQQRQRVAEASARKQQQRRQVKQPQQHRIQQKAARAKKTRQQKVEKQQFCGRPLASAAVAAKLTQQGTSQPTMEKKEGETVNQVTLTEVTRGDEVLSWKHATSPPETRAPCCVDGFRQEETADPSDSDAAARSDFQEAAHAATVGNVTGSTTYCPPAAVSAAGTAHGSSATVGAQRGDVRSSDSAVEAPSSEKGGGSAHDSTGGNVARTRQKTIDSTCTGTPRCSGDTTVPAVLTDHQRHVEGNPRICKRQTEEAGVQVETSEQSHHDVAAAAEGRANITSQCNSNNHAAVSALAGQDGARTGGAAEAERADVDTEEGTSVLLRGELMHTVPHTDRIQPKATPAVKNDLGDSSRKCGRTAGCESDSEDSPAAKSVRNSDSIEGITLFNGYCTSRRTPVQMTCHSMTTDARRDTTGNSNGGSSSTCGGSSRDGGSRRCGISGSSHNSSTCSCNNSGCTGVHSNGKSTDTNKSCTVVGKRQSGSSRCTDSRNTAGAASGEGVETGKVSNNKTSATTSSEFSSGRSDLGGDYDIARVNRSTEEPRGANKSDGSAPTSISSTQTADGINGRGGRKAGSVCRKAAPAAPAGADSRPAGEGRSTRGHSDCRHGGNRSDSSGKAESLAEARFFPVIPRVGTVEIASMWRLIQTAEQLLLELHEEHEQGKSPEQLEKHLPVLVKTLPVWWMSSVDLGVQQQLAALTLHRVLPGLAAWEGRDLRLACSWCVVADTHGVADPVLSPTHAALTLHGVPEQLQKRMLSIGSALPFAARGLLALALCQLEHRIAVLQQQLASAVGGLQVLMASVLLLQQVEEHYAPPIYSLPQHVLACLYSRGGGYPVVNSSTRMRPAAGEGAAELHYRATTSAVRDGSIAGHRVHAGVPSSASHETEANKREQGASKQAHAGQKRFNTLTPSWEAGIRQGAPTALDGFLSYADAFEDYLPTLGREEVALASILGSDSEEALRAPVGARTVPRIGQRRSRGRGVLPSASKVKKNFESGMGKGKKKNLARKRGDASTKERNRKSGIDRKVGAVQAHGRGAK